MTGAPRGPVRVKLAEVRLSGFMALVKAAAMPALMGTPVVGPGMEVMGAVRVTCGLVVSGAGPVVKVQT